MVSVSVSTYKAGKIFAVFFTKVRFFWILLNVNMFVWVQIDYWAIHIDSVFTFEMSTIISDIDIVCWISGHLRASITPRTPSHLILIIFATALKTFKFFDSAPSILYVPIGNWHKICLRLDLQQDNRPVCANLSMELQAKQTRIRMILKLTEF